MNQLYVRILALLSQFNNRVCLLVRNFKYLYNVYDSVISNNRGRDVTRTPIYSKQIETTDNLIKSEEDISKNELTFIHSSETYDRSISRSELIDIVKHEYSKIKQSKHMFEDISQNIKLNINYE